VRLPVCAGGGRRPNGQTSRCEAGREQRAEERQRAKLSAENRALRRIDTQGLIGAGKLADRRDEQAERDKQLY